MLNSYSPTLTKQTLFSTLVLMLMFAVSCQGVNNRYLGSLKYCQNISKQAFLAKVQQYQYNHVIEQQINSAFPANRNQFMQGIFQQNSQKSYQSVKPYLGQYFLNIGTLLLIFLAFLILIPILFFSKCCSCCCTKPTQKYTDCQMKLPSFFIVLFAISLIVICSIVLKINLDYQPKVQDFKCSLGIITDDTLKGRQDQQLKWIGLEPYQMQVKDFIKQMENANETIQLNLSNTSKPMIALQKNINRLEDLVSKVPNNDKSELVLYYPKPLLSTTPRTLTKSSIVEILGTKSIQNSLIKNTTSTLSTIASSLLELNSYSSSLSQALSKISPSKIRRSLSQSIQSTQQIQTNIYSTISIAEKSIQKIYWIVSYVFLGLTIFITFIICIQVVCIGCKNQYTCKSKLCCCCTLLWIVGLLHFLVAVGVAVGGLVAGQSCAYFRESFSNEQNYKNNVGKYLGSGNGIGSALGKCLSSSKDPNYLFNNKISIQTQPALSNFSQYLNSPPLALPNISSFQTQLQKANQTLRQFYQTEKLDITDQQMISQIQQIKYIDECSTDVWVPSLKNQLSQSTNEIKNQTTSGVNNMTCPSLEKFGNRSEGCIVGVIDSTSIFGLVSSKQILIYSLENRYEKCPVPQRKFIVDNLTKIWQSYYSIKKEKLSPVLTRLSLVTQVMKSTKDLLESTIYPSVNTSTKFLQNNLISSLKPSIPSPTTNNSSNSSNNSSEPESSTNSSSVPSSSQNQSSPIQGYKLAVKNNKDCRVIGKNIDVSIRIICSQGINLIYTLRYLYYTSAVLIFMISCLSICLMNRSENQHQIQLDMQKDINRRQMVRQNNYQLGTQRNLYFKQEIPRSHPYF